MSFFKKIAGLIAGESPGPDLALAARLATGLVPLAGIQADLPKRAATFVATGNDSAVLLSLENATKPHNPLSVGGGFYRDRTFGHYPAMYGALRDPAFAEPAILIRLGRVFAATMPPELPEYHVRGTSLSPNWFRMLMTAAAYSHLAIEKKREGTDFGIVTLDLVREILATAETGPVPLFDVLVRQDPEKYDGRGADRFAGFAAYVRSQPSDVALAAAALDAEGRIALAKLIRKADAVEPNLDALVKLAVSSAKGVREAAARAVAGTPAAALDAATAPIFAGKSTEPKLLAIALLGRTLGAASREPLERLLAAEPSKKIVDAIAFELSALGGPNGSTSQPDDDPSRYRAIDGSDVEIPPEPSFPPSAPLPESLRAPLRAMVATFNAERKAAWEKSTHKHHAPTSLDANAVNAFFDIANGVPTDADALDIVGYSSQAWESRKAFDRILTGPDIGVRHLLRLHARSNRRFPQPMPRLIEDYDRTAIADALRDRIVRELGDLRVVHAMHVADGRDPVAVGRAIAARQPWGSVEPDLASIVWPFLATQFAAFEEAFGSRGTATGPALSVQAALEAIALFPKTPQRLLPALIRVAMSGTKTERRAARDLIAAAPDLDASIANLLDDGKTETRADAAAWLAERDARAQIPRIVAALESEKTEKARASYLAALSKLGADIGAYVGEATLLAEAQRGLKKTGLKGLEWFPFDALPPLRWANGDPVAPEVVRWWFVFANKIKEPAGNPLFEFYFDRLRPADVAVLGTFVVSAFIERDTLHPPESDAIAYADANVGGQFAAISRYDKNATRESVYARLKSDVLGRHLHSASDNRGILALATRANGAEAAARVRTYLRDHGPRTSQSKALLATLAANRAPAAIQVVLATANRFKQRSIQEYATELVNGIAESRGWTPDELADNTIPTGGLGDDGTLELDCGPDRTYTARLDARDKLELFGPQGKAAKTLPAQRTEADAEPLKEAKRALAAAKKEVAQVVELQTSRLFDAMCLERTWTPDEWERLLARHPIVGRLCRRLVWLALDDAGVTLATFRPLDDGTLSDATDASVSLASAHAVKLAHRALVSADVADAWTTHLADYEVAPLVEQFARPVLAPDAATANHDRIVDRYGWLIDSLKLRSAATKRGYQPGPSEDGGVFSEYLRRHPGAGLQAEIAFTGSFPGQQGGTSAFHELRFVRVGRRAAKPIRLADVPPVLLSECWNDLHEIAASGLGFDAEWEKKVSF